MAITHTFKSSRGSTRYYAYIEDGQLVLGDEGPWVGGVFYRGTYEGAEKWLAELKVEAPRTYNDIQKYFMKHDPDVVLRSPSTLKASDLKPGDKFKYNGCEYLTVGTKLSECYKIDMFENYLSIVNLINYSLGYIEKGSEVELIR